MCGLGVKASYWEWTRSFGAVTVPKGLALKLIETAILAYVQKFIPLPQSSVTLDTEELKDIWLRRQREIRKKKK